MPGSHGQYAQETNETNLKQKLSITFTTIPGQDNTALIIEVITGEIRRGNVAGNEKKFSWIMEPS